MTYTREDLIATLNAVQPYDWRTFLAQRIDAITPHPPDPFTPAGWRVVYTPTPSAFYKLREGHGKILDARFSLGFVAKTDGTVLDVIGGSPAAHADLGPGAKIVAINGRALDAGDAQTNLDGALRDAQRSKTIALLTVAGNVYRTVTMAYSGGPRYPHLERITGSRDLLAAIGAAHRQR